MSSTFTHSLGNGGELNILLNLDPLPADVGPDSIVRASVRLPCKSYSKTPGTARFRIYMLTSDDSREPFVSPDGIEFPMSGELSSDAKPLSSGGLSHDAGWKTRYIDTYPPIIIRIEYVDTDVKHLTFDITEAVRAWVSGTPNVGLRVKQQSGFNGPEWNILDTQDDGGERPVARVCIQKAEKERP